MMHRKHYHRKKHKHVVFRDLIFHIHHIIVFFFVLLEFGRSETFYDILGVKENAKDKDIKKAFRKLALEFHPDKLGPFETEEEEEEANNNFVKMLHAYEVLVDADRRRQYDLGGMQDPDASAQQSSDLNQDVKYPEEPFDLVARFRGGAFTFHYTGQGIKKMDNTQIEIPFTLEQLMKGHKMKYTLPRMEICTACKGTGSSNTANMPKCNLCEGSGRSLHLHEQDFANEGSKGWFKQGVGMRCRLCKGTGKVSDGGCSECEGARTILKKKDFDIPVAKGTPPGFQFEYVNEGNQHPDRPPGTVIFTVGYTPHPKFELTKDGDLIYKATISLMDALTGFTRELKLVTGGSIKFVHDFVTFGGYRKTYPGWGMPKTDGSGAADLHVDIDVEFPHRLTNEMTLLLKKILSNEEFQILEGVLRLLSNQQEAVPVASKEFLYCNQCVYDFTESPYNCCPITYYWSWARTVINILIAHG